MQSPFIFRIDCRYQPGTIFPSRVVLREAFRSPVNYTKPNKISGLSRLPSLVYLLIGPLTLWAKGAFLSSTWSSRRSTLSPASTNARFSSLTAFRTCAGLYESLVMPEGAEMHHPVVSIKCSIRLPRAWSGLRPLSAKSSFSARTGRLTLRRYVLSSIDWASVLPRFPPRKVNVRRDGR